jgi:predicted O-methyltransferase YrrM
MSANSLYYKATGNPSIQTSQMARLFRNLIRSIAKDIAHGQAAFTLSRPELALRDELQRQAMAQAAEFVKEHMQNALFCDDRLTHLEYALSQRPPGPILEFGVYKAITTNFIARSCPDTQIYGFDSFQGLPEHWSGNRFSRRNFNRRGRLPKVASNVELIVGLFQDTLEPFLERIPGPFAVVHIDCDLYSSTRYVLTRLNGRLVDGAVMIFDEFFNYHGYQLHEFKAFNEFLEETGLVPDYLAFSGQQVSVRLNSPKDKSRKAGASRAGGADRSRP